ncbi:hypothetical protein MCOR25_009005 [Pyricularia grisea]|nr:hypothetical protein MCOR25_009005 [Pyricularia grisea]
MTPRPDKHPLLNSYLAEQKHLLKKPNLNEDKETEMKKILSTGSQNKGEAGQQEKPRPDKRSDSPVKTGNEKRDAQNGDRNVNSEPMPKVLEELQKAVIARVEKAESKVSTANLYNPA